MCIEQFSPFNNTPVIQKESESIIFFNSALKNTFSEIFCYADFNVDSL